MKRKKLVQRAMHCGCGNTKILARGLCATCYTLKRKDVEDFAGLRESVLKRDGHMCRVCAELLEIDRLCVGQSPSVHHRVPGVSKLHLMITLCAAHHAIVGHLQVADKPMSPLLLTLWREQHPLSHEQTMFDFMLKKQPLATNVRLFEERREGK